MLLLSKFRVTNFRSVIDSDWIDTEDVTALIGENEAGKTNILLPLWKLKPSGGGEINLVDDMPRSLYAEMREHPDQHTFIRAVFILTDEERSFLEKFGIDQGKVTHIEVSRKFSGEYDVCLIDCLDVDSNNTFKIHNEESAEVKSDTSESLKSAIISKIPKFVYYSNYGNLDAQIYLPHVIENMKRDDLGPKELAKVRTIKVLFDLVNLSADEIYELATRTVITEKYNHLNQLIQRVDQSENQQELGNDKVRERSILLQSASSKLTKSFKDWWKQGNYVFELQADGNYFRIWVSDSRRPEKVELENRSTGLQWFLSFFLVFTYESDAAHDNSIVLLDEPGHSLHPLAQRDLSDFFNSLSEKHQILFTTHSPFIIDADRLDRVRKIYIDACGGTVASSNLGAGRSRSGTREAGATYAVHSALNLSVAESLLLGCEPIIVEGPSDQHYLSAIKNILVSRSLIRPSMELVFPPSGGAKTAKIIASILLGRDDTLPFVLLDSDSPGKQAAKALKESLYAGHESSVLNTDQFIDGIQNTEIEDLIPPELIIELIDKMERRPDTDFEGTYEEGKPIVPQIKSWASAHNVALVANWKVQLSIETKQKLQKKPDKYVDEKFIIIWTNLFEAFLKK
ncbi:MAG: ATP-binding protein [Acetobacter peroxydans]|jgi:energy-coupling factor transporter ATP-binding protein EcfA2/5S rRNA maturation endonuclease (ribonuclease M5)|nr:ATP-binding protein [Acetobacter peroxydans]